MGFRCFDAGMYHCLAILDSPTVPILPPTLGERCFGTTALWALLDGEVEYDVSVRVAGADAVLGAHRCVLRARCFALHDRLRDTQSNGRRWELDLADYQASTIRALLEYLYCDYCRAAPDVAASLRPLAEELSLHHLLAGVSAATRTESCGSDVCWVRTAAGKWTQVSTDTAPRTVVASTYTQDLLSLVAETGGDDFVELVIKQVDGVTSRSVHAARPLLLTSGFFRALLEGGFSEAQGLRIGSGSIEVAADSVDAFVLCLRMLASGDAVKLMPASADEALAVMAEAHRLGFQDALRAAELKLGEAVVAGATDEESFKAIGNAAQLYDLDRLANEVARRVEDMTE